MSVFILHLVELVSQSLAIRGHFAIIKSLFVAVLCRSNCYTSLCHLFFCLKTFTCFWSCHTALLFLQVAAAVRTGRFFVKYYSICKNPQLFAPCNMYTSLWRTLYMNFYTWKSIAATQGRGKKNISHIKTWSFVKFEFYIMLGSTNSEIVLLLITIEADFKNAWGYTVDSYRWTRSKMERWRPFKQMSAACPAHAPKTYSGFCVYFLVMRLADCAQ